MDKHRAPEQQRAEIEPLRTQFLPEADFTDEEIADLKFVAADCIYQLYMINQEALPVLRNAKAPGARARLDELANKRESAIVKSINELRRRLGDGRFALIDTLVRKSELPRIRTFAREQNSLATEWPSDCSDVSLSAHIWFDGSSLLGHAILSAPRGCASPTDGSAMQGNLEARMMADYQFAEGYGTLELWLFSPLLYYGPQTISADAYFWSMSGEFFPFDHVSETITVNPPEPPPSPTVTIQVEEGKQLGSNAFVLMGADQTTTNLTATGSPSGGTFQWSVGSKIGFQGPSTGQNVTIVGNSASTQAGDAWVSVTYTYMGVTAGASIRVTVRVPTVLLASNVSTLSAPPGYYGYITYVTYHVLDQNPLGNQNIEVEGIGVREVLQTVFSSTTVDWDPPDGVPRTVQTSSEGKIMDLLSAISTAELPTGFSATRTQAWTLSGYALSPQNTQTYGRTYAEISETRFSH
jgi:hypothetical protein